ncbi:MULTISPECIES: RraA family protein [Brenneria]|uniref:Putative 4-hydroxy-4-methyl-2-oxoglutarate aldolase n=1 Tax=Brenneria nigrifluens DSM 30175 = ATCC 13028 TaxID=1121120 RepID=A0A2U1UP22_9GAMM|nr:MULTISPECIES: RraA family protein [Brenneria]EHD23436.1 Dimethylmenaquinone methyltransferase [Brenneria sp. EniD312]PWC23364.1 RraA family protein [Brenneria nigrifluens] [Brenneria nigrifluens DSM 30175 = ATCC 13028]QCR06363.1 RraA family protein [Brenneria nigrifluens] [Brenneria nigrifluens DSM 30175 = ATCC 13028]
MSNNGFQIKKYFNRPQKYLIDEFKKLPAANIGDVMNRQFCLSNKIRPLNDLKLAGPAFTVNLRSGDNLLFYKAIGMASPGDVIVVNGQGGEKNALMGELMLRWAMKKGIAGIIINGMVRDLDFIQQSPISVFALGATPAGPFKDGPGEINFPISIDGVVITPGDMIVADLDGAVVVRQNDLESVLEKTKYVTEKEENIKTQIENDEWDMSWVDEKLLEKNCIYL